MKSLKLLIGLLLLVNTACSTTKIVQKPGFQLPPALSETFRGGALKGMEQADSADLGMPSQYDLVGHVCTSEPIFDIYGRFVRTDVRCW